MEIRTLHMLAGGAFKMDAADWHELEPGGELHELARWTVRDRKTDPRTEARAEALRSRIADLQDQLAKVETELEEQRSGELNRKLKAAAAARQAAAAEMEQARRDRATRQVLELKARKRAKAKALAAAMAEVQAEEQPIDWSAVEQRKAAARAAAKSA